MNVFSLFDGIGCGREALKGMGIRVDHYYASEIDKSDKKIATENHPDIIEIGDVRNVSYGRKMVFCTRNAVIFVQTRLICS